MTETHTRTIAGIPLWLLRDYLQELGGHTVAAGKATRVEGDGWTATVERAPDHHTGSLCVGQVRLTLTGAPPALAALAPLLERKLMRGGG